MIIDKLFIVSKYIFTLILFLLNVFIVKSLEINTFGELSFFRLAIQYLQYTELGLLQYVFRSLSAGEKVDRNDVNKIITYLLISIFSVFTIFTLVGYKLSFFSNNVFQLLLLSCIINGLFGKHAIDKLRIEGKVKVIVLLEGVSILLLVIGTVSSIFLFKQKLFVILVTYSIYHIPYTIYFLFFQYKDWAFKFDFKINREMLTESLMLLSFGLVSLMFFSADRLIIKFNWGFHALGLYALPLSVVSGGFMVMQSILWLNMPNFIHSIKNTTDSNKQRVEFNSYKRRLFKINLVIFFIGLVGYKALTFFFLQKYEGTTVVFALLFIFHLFSILYVYEQNYLIAFKKYKVLVGSHLLIVLFNFATNYYLSRFHNVELLIIVSIIYHVLLWRLLVFRVKQCTY